MDALLNENGPGQERSGNGGRHGSENEREFDDRNQLVGGREGDVRKYVGGNGLFWWYRRGWRKEGMMQKMEQKDDVIWGNRNTLSFGLD